MDGYVKKEKKLDQFYTNVETAKYCIEKINSILPDLNIFLEPSAGNGSFTDILIKDGYKVFAFDLDPKKDYITKKDYLSVDIKDLDNISSNDVCVIGNPPFGKNSSLAVKFFNHSSKLSNYICFIVPKTFKKQSIHNRLNLFFHLKYEEDLPKYSFVFCGEKYDVPCVFQIWIKKDKKRKISKKITTDLFDFVSIDKANLAIRRVGGSTGRVYENFKDFSEASNYFIKTKISKKKFIELINKIDFTSFINSTAGVRSLSKHELITNVEKVYERKI